jgi:ATP-dependent Zn protease
MDGIGHRGKLSGEFVQYWRVVINELLALTSRPIDGVIVLGATNYADEIDAAILRSGRIEEKFALSIPDFRLRAEILAYHLDFDIDLMELADVVEELEGWSGADLELLARRAKRQARTGQRAIRIEDLVAMLPQRRRFSPTERYRLAVHEAGHAVVALALGYCRSAKIVIQETFDPAQGANLGGTTSYDMEEDWLPTESALLTRIAVALAGLAAEEVVLKDRSIGSGGALGTDVERATVIARRMVVSYGLGKIPIFLRRVEDVDCHTPIPADFEREVRVILAAQYSRVRTLLAQERDVLIATANEAMVRGSLIVGEVNEPPRDSTSSAA